MSKEKYPDAVFISAYHKGEEILEQKIMAFIKKRMKSYEVRLDYQQLNKLSYISSGSFCNNPAARMLSIGDILVIALLTI